MRSGGPSHRGDDGARCHLFYGPDEAGSRARALALVPTFGAEAERIDLPASRLKSDPALLADEAASASLFGGPRYLWVDPAGDECLSAVELLLASTTALHPVVLVAGAIRKDSRLVKLVDAHAAGRAVASYIPDTDELVRIAIGMAAAQGLRLDGDLGRRIVEAAASDRAILASEIEKLALYLDATPRSPVTATGDDIDAIGAHLNDADTAAVVGALASGDVRGLDRALAGLASDGQDGIAVVRGALRRLLAMSAVRAEIGRGVPPRAAIDKAGRALFWKEKDSIARDIQRWPAARLEAAIDRVATLERQLKSNRGAGPIATDQLFHAIARSVQR